MAIDSINIGDLIIIDDKKLGFSIRAPSGQKIWFNTLGIDALCEWLQKKRLDSNVCNDDQIRAGEKNGE